MKILKSVWLLYAHDDVIFFFKKRPRSRDAEVAVRYVQATANKKAKARKS